MVIYSMASSSAALAPRGVDFLYDLHRLNVALSRAKALSLVVASPELLNAEQVRLTGPKEESKIYYRHSGFPGGIRSQSAGRLRASHPERLLRLAITGMPVAIASTKRASRNT